MYNSNNQSNNQPVPQTAKLNLDKYGLNDLAEKHLWGLTNSELDELMDAFVNEDIAPTIDLLADPKIIRDLQNTSFCRGCGKCCLGDSTSNPLHPGLEVYEDELKMMGKHGHVSYKLLKKRTGTGQVLKNPERPSEVAKTRWLAFPCMFYDTKIKRCQVYEFRPIVCKIYPLTIENSLCVKVNCEYGKDIYRSYISELKNRARFSFPNSVSKL